MPTAPDPRPRTPLEVTVTPSPIRATFVDHSGNLSNYRATADVTFTEVGGVGVRITQVTATLMKTALTEQGFTFSIGLSFTSDASHQVPAGGSLTQSHPLQFGVGPGETVTSSFQVTGVDSHGQSFVATSANIRVELVIPGEPGGA